MHAPIPPPLAPDMLLMAYRSGIFPMADARDDRDIFWVEPKIRAILPLNGFRCSKSLAKKLKRQTFTITCNQAFADVVDACAAPRTCADDTWISYRIADSYLRLHALGHAHSIECWQSDANGDQNLVGGLYGVGFDRVFCGESMFSTVTDASKLALSWLIMALKFSGTSLLDCQFMTPHLASLGAIEISQAQYLALLAQAQSESFRKPPVPPKSGLIAHFQRSASPASASLTTGTATGSFAESAAVSLPTGFAALLLAAKSSGFSSSPGNFIAQSLTQTS